MKFRNFTSIKIANPLCDHVFKYLMSNGKLACKVLSVILDKEVLKLEFSQQEVVIEDEIRRFTLYRLDFKAVILDETGRREALLIELQKSKLPTNVLPFHNCLGWPTRTKSRKKYPKPRPSKKAPCRLSPFTYWAINVEDIPLAAVKADCKIMDASRQEELPIQSNLINLLTHVCYILQVRRLPEQRRSRIGQFLTLFNQAWVMEEKYVLDLQEVPKEFKDVAA